MERRTLTYAAAAVGAVFAARAIGRRRNAYDLRDRVVAITGGSRGLGLVLARELIARGAKVAICARDPEEVARARSELVERGGRIVAVACDITDATELGGFVATTRTELGPIDVLVNNAGVIEVGPMEVMTLDDYGRAMATHFWAPLHATLAVLPEMRRRREGGIVNITSIGGKIAVPHLLPYTASKFALVGLSEGMRAELAKDGIWVTTVVPGLMRTGSQVNAAFKGQQELEYAWFATAASTPLTAMQAERAARRIVTAMEHREPEVVLGVQAKLALKLHALAPGLAQRVLGLVNRMLPGAAGGSWSSKPGRESDSLVPDVIARATERTAERNNEL